MSSPVTRSNDMEMGTLSPVAFGDDPLSRRAIDDAPPVASIYPEVQSFKDELIVPLKELLVQVAKGVAEAQHALDQQSLQFQREIYTDAELEDLLDAGIEAIWYQIPEVTVSLKVSLSMHSESESDSDGIIKPKLPFQLRLAPYNATYKNSYDYDHQGTSEMKFKIVPIPPPTAATLTTVPNIIGKTEEEARKSLSEAKLILGDMSEKESTEAPGMVIEQNPEAGTRIDVGETVDIVISKST